MAKRTLRLVYVSTMTKDVFNFCVVSTNEEATSSAIIGNVMVMYYRNEVIFDINETNVMTLTTEEKDHLREEALRKAKDIHKNFYRSPYGT